MTDRAGNIEFLQGWGIYVGKPDEALEQEVIEAVRILGADGYIVRMACTSDVDMLNVSGEGTIRDLTQSRQTIAPTIAPTIARGGEDVFEEERRSVAAECLVHQA
ncbi:hypothetical protein PG999_002994 [Apiospora kogelbergensis]|uniref:Uncharacterized protein n=1 Tax=Apiospora kogelbergensis TaxID=1337665 RepID=A0AAW0R9Q1_9PEZI